MLGSLADRIRVPDQFVAAIETALGHHLQLVLTEQPEVGAADSGRPEREQAGPRQHRAAGASTRQRPRRASHEQPSHGAEAALAGRRPPAMPATDRAERRAAGRDRAWSRAMLGAAARRTLAGHDPHRAGSGAATAAWRETNGAFHYVTLAGDLLSRHGVYTGGYSNGNGNGKAPASILGRKNQIAELQARAGAAAGAGGRDQPPQGRAAERADRAAGQPAAGPNRVARAGSRHRHPRRRVQCAAEFAARAAPEDRHGRLRNPEPGRAGTGRHCKSAPRWPRRPANWKRASRRSRRRWPN